MSWPKPFKKAQPVEPVEVEKPTPTIRPDHCAPDILALRRAETRFQNAIRVAENEHRAALHGVTDPRTVHQLNRSLQEARERARVQLSHDKLAAGAGG